MDRMSHMKVLTTILALLITSFAFAEPVESRREGQYYEGYRRYRTSAERDFQTNFNEGDAAAGATTANAVTSYIRNPYTGTLIQPKRPPGAGVVVMSDAHLDAKKFIDWVEAGRPANHPFAKSYEGSTFRKFMDGIPDAVAQRKASGAAITSMDVVWGGDPFDRKAFEALSEVDRKKAFTYFAEELKRMPKVEGVNYNFVASLGDHEVTKVNGSWDNATAWKAAKSNGQSTAAKKLEGLRTSALEDIAAKQFDELLDKGPITVEVDGKKMTVSDPSDWTKEAQKARKAKMKELMKTVSSNPDYIDEAKRVARANYEDLIKSGGRQMIDIPKVNLGSLDELDALPQSVIDRMKGMDISDGSNLYEALKKEIARGGVLDANNSTLHREMLEKYGKVHGGLEDMFFTGEPNSAKVQAFADADKMDDFMKTKPRPIGAAEGDFLKRSGVKPPARARQLGGIDDQLQISKYSDMFAESFEKNGFRVDRSTFSPYESTVSTKMNGQQYAHRHVQYGNLDRVVLEKPQMDAIVSNNTGSNGKRIKLPEVRVELQAGQADEIKKFTGAAPDELLGRATITDDMFRSMEDVVRTGKLPGGATASPDDIAKARELLGTESKGLLRGQHVTTMGSSTTAGMVDQKINIPGRTDVLENAGQQGYGQHLQADNGRIVQNHSKTTMGRSSASDVGRLNGMDRNAVLFTSDTHNPSMNFAAAMDPEMADYIDELCPGCVGTRPEINSGSMSASAKNPGRPNTVAIDFGDGKPTHLQMDPKTGAITNFDAVPKEQREWLKKLKEAQQAGDDAFVKFLMDPETGRDPITRRSMLGDDPVDALRNILPCK